jgi:hypothetical protein
MKFCHSSTRANHDPPFWSHLTLSAGKSLPSPISTRCSRLLTRRHQLIR